ncbi:uncharacterized protein YER152C-like isoform X1 [Asterias rubens]|uniref:uncharacterized protein YER152C-like isoform X1 n=1 Tax=Asterias rubens TaxID=7604 RepID=UPI0014556EAD|nr:uncharacterized protein YER152C-like isoform X1 [Asterias rubens]
MFMPTTARLSRAALTSARYLSPIVSPSLTAATSPFQTSFKIRCLSSTSSTMAESCIPVKKRRTEITESGPMAENDFKSRGLFLNVKQNLTVGGPGPDRLKAVAGLLSKASVKRMGEEAAGEADLLQYGNPYGDPLCRIELAKFLSDAYGMPVDCNDLLTTGGATQAMSFLLSYFFTAGDTIFVEDPTYFIHLGIFKDADMKAVPVPLQKDGIDTETLEVKLKEMKAKSSWEPTAAHPFRAMLYVITVFQNPTTLCYSKAKCERIIELAREYDLLVVSDDIYNVLSWVPTGGDELGLAPPRLFSYDKKDDPGYKANVVSCGSFSKFMCPGVRLGWFETAPRIIDMMRKSSYLLSGGNFNTLASGIMGAALEMNLVQNHLAWLRKTYSASSRAMWKTLQAEMPEGVRVAEPQGGYFIWVELPEGSDAAEVLKIAKEEFKVAFLPGQKASPSGKYANCMRLSFSFYLDSDLQEGAKGIAAATKKYLSK